VETMMLIVGARVLVTLSGMGSAGYRWTATIDNPAIVEVVRAPTPSAPADQPRSFSRDEQFAMIGLAPGETIVRFRQARTFEPEHAPIATRDIIVHVTN
jgi:Chagasin family peptidase inhibitor I42